MYLDVHQCVLVYINVHQCVPVYIYVHQCVRTYASGCTPVCACVSAWMYTSVYLCIGMYVHMRKYVYITHTSVYPYTYTYQPANVLTYTHAVTPTHPMFIPYSGKFSQMAPKIKLRGCWLTVQNKNAIMPNSWILFSQMLGQPRNPRKFCPAKIFRYTVFYV